DHAEHLPDRNNYIKLPNEIVLQSQNLQDLISFVYPDLTSPNTNSSYFIDRAILAPKNTDVSLLNSTTMNLYSGQKFEYLSADLIDNSTGSNRHNYETLYPLEYLHSLNKSGLPPHKLSLKIGASIMLLHNINPSEGLCNGTRLICCTFSQHVIEVQVISGKHTE
ncbi:21607_t:CDS:1, partial [Cetraspora pellucida]